MTCTECKNIAYRIKMRFPLQSTEVTINFLNDITTIFTHTNQPADCERTAVHRSPLTNLDAKIAGELAGVRGRRSRVEHTWFLNSGTSLSMSCKVTDWSTSSPGPSPPRFSKWRIDPPFWKSSRRRLWGRGCWLITHILIMAKKLFRLHSSLNFSRLLLSLSLGRETSEGTGR